MLPWRFSLIQFSGAQHSLSPLSLATDVTHATLGASGLWLGTRTGAGGTTTQA